MGTGHSSLKKGGVNLSVPSRNDLSLLLYSNIPVSKEL